MTELTALTLHLRPTHQDEIPAWTGRAAYAWFLASLQHIQPELAGIIHDQQGIKPFTVSRLSGIRPSDKGLTIIQPDHVYKLRVTTLHADLTRLTLNVLMADWLSHGVVLHDQPFRVERIVTDETADCWTGTDDYADLLQRYTLSGPAGRLPHRLHFTFASPTSFNKTGGHQMPLPLPELVFGSLIERWKAFASVPLHPDLLAFVKECVVISQHRIQTERVSFERSDRGAVVGFVGDAAFTIQSSDAYWLGQLQMLAAFARYSGVGVRTTMGLGQARARLSVSVPA